MASVGAIEKLAKTYKDKAHIYVVYIREAHPTDGWRMASNDKAGICVQQPRTLLERVAVAGQCCTAL